MPNENVKFFNPAAGPLQEETVIVTSVDGLAVGDVDIPAQDRTISAYFARPAGQPDPPLLLLLCEAFGVHEHIRDVVRRFAKEGYFAVAPDLMVRQGNPESFNDISVLVQDLLLKIPDDQVMTDLDSTVQWAEEQGANILQASVTGFCWGGRWTWLYASHRKLNAAVAWYGILDGRRSDIFRGVLDRYPKHPIDLIGSLQTPVLGLYGGSDDAISLATIKDMQAALQEGSEAAKRSEIQIYLEAGHAFVADYRSSYRKTAALDGWNRCLAWLRELRSL
ncbi:Carboxymethylenebutenolidase [Acidisarcina polymorpha]|uniref:Carboxymethylenebutenolidase n=1 Tax=Acidisarcina polymorpha TaxID=2211140 RepID=A0A2Z5G9G7_9BACT|nr:dienelactone hydrolase family protein [Acidisarcina polymorpha]AXC15467.1 Carboxymethylenebutenolidase [Acidisarcina polymorpha]